MVLVIALLAYFCLVGVVARRFDARTRLLLVAGIAVLVMVDLVGRAFL